MTAIGVYRVTGDRAHRGHQPGEVFWAALPPDAEARAIARGSITLLERLEAVLPNNKYRLPTGWPTTAGRE